MCNLTVTSKRTGTEYSYETIGGKPTNEYFRDKQREYRKKRGIINTYSAQLTAADQAIAWELHATGLSQQAIAKRLKTTRHRIQVTLGLR
jgi:hypothetical protein